LKSYNCGESKIVAEKMLPITITLLITLIMINLTQSYITLIPSISFYKSISFKNNELTLCAKIDDSDNPTTSSKDDKVTKGNKKAMEVRTVNEVWGGGGVKEVGRGLLL